MLWYPVAGAGLSAVGTLASVLAFSLPYWIQLQKDVDVTGNGVTDVSVTFTHGLWQYCNLVTTSSERTENCGENQSHSDSDQATECLLCLAIILSINAVVQTVLYMTSRFPLMYQQNVALYLAVGSATIASLLVTAGLVVYGISEHNIRITDTLRLESSAASLYACFWLAAAGGVFTAASVPLLLLTAWTNIRASPDKTTDPSIGSLGSLVSSGSSTKSYDNFSFRTKFSEYPGKAYRNTSSEEEYSSDEDERAPPPYIPDDVVKVSSFADIPLPKGAFVANDSSSDSDGDDRPPKPGLDDDEASVRKLAVVIPESDGKYNIDEKLVISPEALKDSGEFSKQHDEIRDDEKLVVDLSQVTDKEATKNVDDIPTEQFETDQDTISVELNAGQEMLDMPLFGIDEEDESESTDDEAGMNQFQMSGQQVGTPRRFGMTPVETTARPSLQRENSNLSSNSAFKYLLQHVSSENLADDSDQDAAQPPDYPLSFEDPMEPAHPPADTRGLFIPVVLSSEKKSLFNLPLPMSIVDQTQHPKPKMPKKPVFFNAARTKTTYGRPVLTIPQYPDVPFQKRKRKHVSPKPKKKKMPTFKESIRFKKDFKTLPPPPPDDSEC